MLMHKKSSSSASNAENLIVRVDEFIEKDGQTGVKGMNLANNEPVTVFLTDRGEAANNPKRPPLSDFNAEGKLVHTQPGGVIAFNGAFGGKGGEYIATWPNFMAKDAEQAKGVRTNLPVSVLVHHTTEGKPFGHAVVWQQGMIVAAPNFEAVENALTQWAERVSSTSARPGALVRSLNAAGEVTGYEYIEARYNKEKQAVETAAEMLERVREYEGFQALSQADAAAFEVVPSVVLSLSNMMFEKRPAYYESIAKSYTDGDHLMAKSTTYTMDRKGIFVDKIFPHAPYEPGTDPVLLTKDGAPRNFSADFGQAKTAEAGAEADKGENNPFEEAPAV